MLRAAQKKRVLAMLTVDEAPLKVLILDSATQGLLSSLLKVSDLRTAGVTAHFLLTAPRDAVRDAPAVYFVSDADVLPDELSRGLYGSYYFNLSTFFRRSQLETLAVRASEARVAPLVRAVHDRFLDFAAVQDQLFTLRIADSYCQRDDPAVIRRAVSGLLSVFVTLGDAPFIVSSGHEVARMLDQRLRGMQVVRAGVRRPLLLVLDRGFDLATPLRHALAYIALVHDVLGVTDNSVALPVSGGKPNVADLDVDSEFFTANAYADFPAVAETVDRELHAYKREMAMRAVSDRSSAEEIQRVLDSAPHLQRRNEIISAHLAISMEVLAAIKARALDDFSRLEVNFDREALAAVATRGSDADVLRLALVLATGRQADLAMPLLEKRGLATQARARLVALFRGAAGDSGLRARLGQLLFRRSLPVVTAVEDALAAVRRQAFTGLVTHDPAGRGVFAAEISCVVVYVHGGASHVEMQALQEYAAVIKTPIIFGGSEILRPEDYLRQLDATVSSGA